MKNKKVFWITEGPVVTNYLSQMVRIIDNLSQRAYLPAEKQIRVEEARKLAGRLQKAEVSDGR